MFFILLTYFNVQFMETSPPTLTYLLSIGHLAGLIGMVIDFFLRAWIV